jgi:hypothetical protein
MSDTEAPPKVSQLDLIVEKYVQLRDLKAEKKSAYQKEVDALDAAMERVEGHLLKTLQGMGVESIRTQFGTAYQQLRTSATVADFDAVLAFIREGEHWSMLEKRVSKPFVEAYKEEHNDLPPGINWREERVINVRRN